MTSVDNSNCENVLHVLHNDHKPNIIPIDGGETRETNGYSNNNDNRKVFKFVVWLNALCLVFTAKSPEVNLHHMLLVH